MCTYWYDVILLIPGMWSVLSSSHSFLLRCTHVLHRNRVTLTIMTIIPLRSAPLFVAWHVLDMSLSVLVCPCKISEVPGSEYWLGNKPPTTTVWSPNKSYITVSCSSSIIGWWSFKGSAIGLCGHRLTARDASVAAAAAAAAIICTRCVCMYKGTATILACLLLLGERRNIKKMWENWICPTAGACLTWNTQRTI